MKNASYFGTVISVVSHSQADLVVKLLMSVRDNKATSTQVIVRENVFCCIDKTIAEVKKVYPEACVIVNQRQYGFGRNHNLNFDLIGSEFFVVLNPDLQITPSSLASAEFNLSKNRVALTYAQQAQINRQMLDCERELITPWAAIKRHIFRQKMHKSRIDWISGAFMAFRSDVFQELGGFDERYFMYCEDVDICLRLQLAGYKIQRLNTTVVHDTRRNTLKSWQHLRWHVLSLIRLWCSPVFWRYLKWRQTNNGFIDHEGNPIQR
jgi:N-acetylglucosaminyl-diphospho-decaprenol L-rhamnosyltransferase